MRLGPWRRYSAVATALWFGYRKAVGEGNLGLADEWADSLDLLTQSLARVGPEGAVLLAAGCLQAWLDEVEGGIAGDVPEDVVKENEGILAVFRFPLSADEREAVDRMVREEIEFEKKNAPGRE